jgi:DNA polymerase I
MDTPQLLLVDGHSLAFRSFYAHAKGKDGGLKTAEGIPTSICFGFLKSLLEVIDHHQPQHLAIAFDLAAPTFRHDADASYKGNRSETPEDFIPDIQNLYELLAALNIPMVTAEGFEADDVLGTLATRASQQGYRVQIVTGDRDLFQLVNDAAGIGVLYLSSGPFQRSGGLQTFNEQAVWDKLEVRPDQIVDYKALCGDKSDCIPGVRGIGEKSAVQLLGEFQTLQVLYDSLDQVPGAKQTKLRDGRDDAFHSQHLAKIVTDVPLELELAETKLRGFALDNVVPILEKLELQKFLKRLDAIHQTLGGAPLGDGGLASIPAKKVAAAEEDGDDVWFFSAEDEVKILPKIEFPLMLVQTEGQLQALVEILEKHCTDPVAWDTETTALVARDATLVGLGCCWGAETSEVAYIPIGHTSGENLPIELVWQYLRPILESAGHPKVLQNAKFDRLILRHQGIELAGVVADTMLMSYVLDPEATHNLTDLAKRYLGLNSTSYKELVPKGQTIADVPIEQVAQYCAMDVYATWGIYEPLLAELMLQSGLKFGEQEKPTLLKLWREVEQPLEAVLADIEDLGIRLDCDYLEQLSAQLAIDLAGIEKESYELAGDTFNMASPKQVGQLLFEQLGLPTKGIRKTKTGYSTDVQTLEKLQGQHGMVDLILQHRTLAKLKSTYTDALPKLVHPQTDRLHTDFNQAVTSTGRLSSSDPNLQNIPIRTEFSRQLRKAFIPRAGWILVTADYSQIELRILAHLSQEPVLVNAYQQGLDIHSVTARLLLDKEEITSEERRMGKIINFGVIYGMGAAKFGREMGVSNAVGKEFIEKYYDRYDGVFRYLEQVKRQAVSQGFVETICGRRRHFKFEGGSLRKLHGADLEAIDLDSLKGLSMNDASALRQAANAPIQGSSADIIKLAMIELHRLLQGYEARLLLQVHDELVLEMPPEEWPILQPAIAQAMENAVQLSVPLLVEMGTGPNWMEAK